MSAGDERDWAAQFETTFAAPASDVELRVWREVYGPEYPDGLDPFSYVSRSELADFVADVRLGADEVLADVGCGRGGSGLWVATHTGARLVGVDIAESALAASAGRAAALGYAQRSEFRLGSFQDVPAGDAEFDAVLSVDALLFTPDKQAAACELARVLRPGGRLVFTSWDYHSQPAGRPPQVPDHRPLLEAAGFTVLRYDETEDWRRRQTATTEGLLSNVEELAASSGDDVEELRSALLEMEATQGAMIRRVYAVAERRPDRHVG